ncbi:MAG TPA: amidohydrolase family protein [Allosphingosinicella sp.]|uniref:N-acyl-D-amino-acid deacylase family protein n=1 Tax=Allosphingosinicella sp. TaxID=2823234 RepID=UPI002EDA87FE
MRAILAGVGAATLLGAAPAPEPVDLLIRGGTIYTGAADAFIGDVAIKDDRVFRVEPAAAVQAKRIIDATRMVVAPGFIDPHAHIGPDLASSESGKRLIPAFLMQGVTTAFIGNDGYGDPDVGKVLGGAKSVGINYAAFAGFGAIRTQVIGAADRAPTSSELGRMKALVAKAMCEGALGFSTGLFYAPQSFAKTDEVAALAREAGLRGGFYDSHIRDESSYSIGLSAAIDEALAIGRAAQIPVNISHIKALGVDVQGQAPQIIAKIEAAQRQGQRVTADQYPWSASGTTLVSALVPGWAQDGGRAAMLKRLDDPGALARIKAAMAENLRRRGGAAALLITEGDHTGRTLAAVAGGADPVAAAIRVIRVKDPATASFNQSEADIKAFMRRPWVMTSSDASSGHPRVYGSFARKYDKYVRQERVLSLREFIERSSALTAATFGLTGRGKIEAGAFADIVIFDPQRYAARSTYDQPTLLAEGVRTVIVNGRLAVDGGKLTGQAAGRALKRTPPAGSCP